MDEEYGNMKKTSFEQGKASNPIIQQNLRCNITVNLFQVITMTHIYIKVNKYIQYIQFLTVQEASPCPI